MTLMQLIACGAAFSVVCAIFALVRGW